MSTGTAKVSVASVQRRHQVAAGVKRSGDDFKHLNEAVCAYQARGLARGEAIRQAAIDYPALHLQWKADMAGSQQKRFERARVRTGFAG